MKTEKSSGALTGVQLAMLVALTLFWGVNWPILKLGVIDFPPLTFRTSSMLGGLVVLAIAVLAQRQSFVIEKKYWPELLWLTFTNMIVWYTCSIYAVKLLATGRAAILGYTLPIWTALFGLFIFKERLGPRLSLGVAFATVAVGLLLKDELSTMAGRPLGLVLMLSAAAFWGYGTHLMRRRKLPTPLTVLMFWSLAITTVWCLLFVFFFERSQIVRWPNHTEWFAIIYNAFIVFGFCQLAWFKLATVLPPTASTLSVMFIPVLGVFSSQWVLGEQPKAADYAALVLIICAILIVLIRPNASKTAKKS
jgi:drug/metabolite transporter (DMT)-like permease